VSLAGGQHAPTGHCATPCRVLQAAETQVSGALRVNAPTARQLLMQHDFDPLTAVEQGYALRLSRCAGRGNLRAG